MTVLQIITLIFFGIFLAASLNCRLPYNIKIGEAKLILSIITLYLFIFFKVVNKEIEYAEIQKSFNFACNGLIAALAMSVMPVCPERSLFLSAILIIIGTLKLLPYTSMNSIAIINIAAISLAFAVVISCIRFYMFDLNQWNKDINKYAANADNKDFVTVPIQPNAPLILWNYYRCAPSIITTTPNSVTNFYCARYYNVKNIVGVIKGCVTVQIEKDNLDLSALSFEFTDKSGNKNTRYPDVVYLDPSREELSNKQAFFLIPLGVDNIKLINNSSDTITFDNITVYSLDGENIQYSID